jgi:hypothetical protein
LILLQMMIRSAFSGSAAVCTTAVLPNAALACVPPTRLLVHLCAVEEGLAACVDHVGVTVAAIYRREKGCEHLLFSLPSLLSSQIKILGRGAAHLQKHFQRVLDCFIRNIFSCRNLERKNEKALG